MKTTIPNATSKIPVTEALLSAHPEKRRDVLIALAEQGLAAVRHALASKVAPLADFAQCPYAHARSTQAMVRAHDNGLLTVLNHTGNLATASKRLADLAEAEGVQHETFGELYGLACNVAHLARKMNDNWKQERVRLLQETELRSFTFPSAVHLVIEALREEPEGAEETAA